MKNIFPQEIINLTVESHFSRFSKSSLLIYLSVLLFLCGIIISIFLIKTEITIQSRGIIRSSGEPIQIIAPISAEVSRSALKENKLVNIGDTLIWLNNQKLKERVLFLKMRNVETEDYLKDIEMMLNYNFDTFTTDLYRAVHAKYRQKLSEFDLSIKRLKKSYARTESLFEKEVIPITEKEESEFQLDYKLEEKKNFVNQTRNEWQQLSVEFKQAIERNNSEIDGLIRDGEKYFIVAPGTGNIANYDGIRPGSFVTTGQNIATISLNDNIISEHLVPPKDIGFLKKDMNVIFQVDAYNYNEWGLATGRVNEISNEIYVVNNQPFFKVKCRLNETYLTLKNGCKGRLIKGLTTTARFQITKRTLAQLFFDKTDDWLNPKIVKE